MVGKGTGRDQHTHSLSHAYSLSHARARAFSLVTDIAPKARAHDLKRTHRHAPSSRCVRARTGACVRACARPQAHAPACALELPRPRLTREKNQLFSLVSQVSLVVRIFSRSRALEQALIASSRSRVRPARARSRARPTCGCTRARARTRTGRTRWWGGRAPGRSAAGAGGASERVCVSGAPGGQRECLIGAGVGGGERAM